MANLTVQAVYLGRPDGTPSKGLTVGNTYELDALILGCIQVVIIADDADHRHYLCAQHMEVTHG